MARRFRDKTSKPSVRHPARMRCTLGIEVLESRWLPAGFSSIINGTLTDDYPAVGLVNDQCSGTLIGPRHVLTAAHCTEDIGETAGSFEAGGLVYGTTAQIEHPAYEPAALGTDDANDIALMTLDRGVADIAPYEIFRGTPQVGQLLTLVGFGAGGDGDTGHLGDFGHKRVGYTPIDDVTETLIHWTFDSDNESNTAPGDSGGPAFLEIEGQLQVAGVTSGGTVAGAGFGDQSFDTRVDAYQPWIDSIVEGAGDEEVEPPIDATATFTRLARLPIDDTSPNTVTSTIAVGGLSAVVRDVNVSFDIRHTWAADLTITLISPSGTRVTLLSGVGEDGDDFRLTQLDDQATRLLSDAQTPFIGPHRPQTSLSALHGESPNGLWRLELFDEFSQDGGVLNRWTLSLSTGPAPPEPTSQFSVVVRFTDDSLTQSQREVFQEAADRWAEIILGDVPDVRTDIGLVDDVVIDVSAESLDGDSGVLGWGGPTRLRFGSFLPARGIVKLDSADVDLLESQGRLRDVALHEIGHVLGIGAIWPDLGLVQDAGRDNPVFIGARAMTEYAALFGLPAPAPVPLANTGAAGARDSHWPESLFGHELMTSHLDGATSPISRVTVGSLEDIGYHVNFDAADAYAPARRLKAAPSHLDIASDALPERADDDHIGPPPVRVLSPEAADLFAARSADLDGDGAVTLLDLVDSAHAVRDARISATPVAYSLRPYDLNRDGWVDVSDLLEIVREVRAELARNV